MGLSPELWGYAENIWRRFPAEFISLGSPDLEDFFELVDGGTWCTRVVDTKSEKVIEIILPRREVPLNSPLTPVVQERYADSEEDEADEREDFELFDEVERIVCSSSTRISKQVEAEVRSQLERLQFPCIERTAELQRYCRRPPLPHHVGLSVAEVGLQTLQYHRRSPEHHEDILSPGDSPSFANTSPRSSVTFNLTPTRTRAVSRKEAPSAPQNLVEQASERLSLDRSLDVAQHPELAASTEGSPSASPTSSGSTRRASMQQGVLAFDLVDLSYLAQRRGFHISHVITSGLRKKYGRGEVRRAPEYDRWANGDLKAENLRIYSGSSNDVHPSEAWRYNRQDRDDSYMREPRSRDETTSPSCSPPDARLMRRGSQGSAKHSASRDNASHTSTFSNPLEPQVFLWDRTSISSNQVNDPDSPGGMLQQIAAQRRNCQMASAGRGNALIDERSKASAAMGMNGPALNHGSASLSHQRIEQQGSAAYSACYASANSRSKIDALMSAHEPNSPAKKRPGVSRAS